MNLERDDSYYMRLAIIEAEEAYKRGEVPVGAVVVAKGQIIAKGYNLTETLTDVTAHAEMQSITAASEFIGGKYLHGCTLYVTLEPCVMCAGALYWSQIDKIVFGAKDEKRGASVKGHLYHPKTEVIQGVLSEECSLLLTDFFKSKRN
jgi:tRNA(adenine34) deaminase